MHILIKAGREVVERDMKPLTTVVFGMDRDSEAIMCLLGGTLDVDKI